MTKSHPDLYAKLYVNTPLEVVDLTASLAVSASEVLALAAALSDGSVWIGRNDTSPGHVDFVSWPVIVEVDWADRAADTADFLSLVTALHSLLKPLSSGIRVASEHEPEVHAALAEYRRSD